MGLLASSVTGDSIHPSYSKILSELISSEAKIIDYLYLLEVELEKYKEDKGNDRRIGRRQIYQKLRLNNLQEALILTNEEFTRSIDNLLRVRLCQHPEQHDSHEVVVSTSLDNDELDVDTEFINNRYTDTGAIRLTNFGKDFVKSCRGPEV